MSSSAHHEMMPSTSDGVPSVDAERTEIRDAPVFSVAISHDDEASTLPQRAVHELVGQNLDHYRIESLVGIGGMGAVFRGRDLRLDRVVAIKVVPMSHRRAEALRRFRIEAQSAAKLDHPNIARVFYVGETERWSYIVFEFIEGTNLRQLVLERGPLSVDDATRFTCQVAEALQHAFERGVVHRDIKPSNILIGLDGRAKIVDMGLARTTQLERSAGDLTASGVTLGTFDYISPEQAHDPRDADVRSDIYSLGCTLYFLLTAQPPFPEGTALQKLLLHGTKMPEDPRCVRNDLSDPLIAILRKMMAKRPKDRYQEPIDLVNDLRTLAATDSLDWRHELPEDANTPILSGRSWWEFFLPAVICLCGIGLVTLWLYNENQRSGVYVIPRVEVNEVSAAEVDVEPGIPPQADRVPSATAGGAPPAAPPSPWTAATNPSAIDSALMTDPSARATGISTIVVGETNSDIEGLSRPFDVVKTLEDAIARWQANEAIERIVVAAPVIRLAKPIALGRTPNGRSLQIQAVGSSRPVLVLRDTVNRMATDAPSAAWFSLDSASLEIQGLDIDVAASASDAAPQALIQLSSGARLRLVDATVTFKSSSAGLEPSVFCFRNHSAQGSSVSGLSIKRSAIRGQADVIRIEAIDRVEIDMEEVWAAVSGSMIDIEGSKSLNRSPRIRALLTHVTSTALNPWVRTRMGTANPYPVAFVRIANESVFSGAQTLVEWDASNVADWPFASQAKRTEDLGRWIDLRGMDNVYDVPSMMRLLQVIMSMSSEEVSIDSDSNLLRNERGMQLIPAWQNTGSWEPSRMHTVTPKSTDEGLSGFHPGCHGDQIPPFPTRVNP